MPYKIKGENNTFFSAKGRSDILQGVTSISFLRANPRTPFSGTKPLLKVKILLDSLAQLCNIQKHLAFYWISTSVPSLPYLVLPCTGLCCKDYLNC